MQTNSSKRMQKPKKEKIGTILDSRVVELLKARANVEGKTIGAIIEAAILQYTEQSPIDFQARLEAVKRLTSRPTTLTTEELTSLINEDIYEV